LPDADPLIAGEEDGEAERGDIGENFCHPPLLLWLVLAFELLRTDEF
jgi:hypothetical protein